jgi:lipid-binding SYLF domain-containing protein
MRRIFSVFSLALCFAVMIVSPAFAQDDEVEDDKNDKTTPAEKRAKIDEVSKEALKTVLDGDESAKALFEKAYGYAVFDNLKLSLFFSTARGRGEAVKKSDGSKVYMRMGSVGLNLGLGGQKCQVVFLFENQAVFDKFVDKGWQADAGANAVAGKSGANAEASFRNGMAVYQITEKGLMLQADIAGTKYWKDKKLNKQDS